MHESSLLLGKKRTISKVYAVTLIFHAGTELYIRYRKNVATVITVHVTWAFEELFFHDFAENPYGQYSFPGVESLREFNGTCTGKAYAVYVYVMVQVRNAFKTLYVVRLHTV